MLYISVALLIIGVCVFLRPIFGPGLFHSHEMWNNIIRLSELDESITHGRLYPRLFSNLLGGYGMPFLNFYAPLTFYVGELFHCLGMSYLTSIQSVFVLGALLAAVGMFLFVRSLWGKVPALVAALAYLFAPYHIVDIYVRGNIAEFFAMGMLPFVLWSFTELTMRKNKAWIVLASLIYGLFILSHNITALFGTGFLGSYLLFRFLAQRKDFPISRVFIALLLGLGLSAFFWLPALIEKEFVRASILIEGANLLEDHFVYFSQLVNPSWGFGLSVAGSEDGMSFQIGILHWLGFAGAIVGVILGKKKGENSFGGTVAFFAVVAIMCVFLMLPVSGFVWKRIELVRFIQFPWRLLLFVSFSTSVLIGAAIHALPRESKVYPVGVLLTAVLCIVVYGSYCKVEGYYPTRVKYNGFNTRRARVDTVAGEYVPKTALSIPEKISDNDLIIAQGEVQWKNLYICDASYEYHIRVSRPSTIKCEALWYPGWNVYLNDRIIESYPSKEEGLIEFRVPRGDYLCKVRFEETPLRLAADYTSAFAIFSILIISLCPKRKGEERDKGTD